MVSSFRTRDYHFDLPESLIAATPLAQRDESRLLMVNRSTHSVEHRLFRDLPEILSAQSTGFELVANNTKVIRARLLGERVGTGGKVEFFLLRKITDAAVPTWVGLMKTGAKVTPGFEFQIPGASTPIRGKVVGRNDTNAGALFTAEFSTDPVQAQVGEVPLPPYIQQKLASEGDLDLTSEKVLNEYNTLFATEEGSVAAPTAGRHFTPDLIAHLQKRGMGWNEITLHVGLGTFKPVTVEDLREHTMHAEWASVSQKVADQLNAAKSSGKKILSIGTTSTRTLEGFSTEGTLSSGERDLDIFIYPGSSHQWNFVDAMITNFHLPESTLLMMIASFIGDREWTLKIYEEAIRLNYRFYSYGDAMLIL